MSVYLVTGGAGFIGSNIASALLERGEKVRVIDDLSTGKLENIDRLKGDFDFIEGDICEPAIVEKAVHGVDYILHQAALPSVPRSIRDPLASNKVNVEGTLILLVAARDAKVKKLVMASSSSVYGNTPLLPKQEQMSPQPLSPYATSKLAAEKYAMNFHQLYGLPTIALRYFNVFGPHQDPNSHYAAVIPKFIKSMLVNEPLVVYGDGEQSRDFTFIENVVSANLLACHSKAAGLFMNAACGERYTLNALLKTLEKVMGVSANQQYEPERVGDVKHSHASIELAKKHIGYEPKVSFEEGLKKTVSWYRELYQRQS
jgi:UDP-glucose 4-epimerase